MSASTPHGRKALSFALALAATMALLPQGTAHAYCRSSSCVEKQEAGRICEPEATDNCGIPLFWNRPCVGFSLQRDASEQVSLAQAESVFEKAFATWEKAACEGGNPGIQISYTGTVECAAVEYNTDDLRNANIVMFHDDEWPHSGAGVLGLTTVTFSRSTGEIYDADMEINTADNEFVMTDKSPALDLISVATHEAGHFLGLAHSPEEDATMFPAYTPGTITQRTLSDDDVHGICDAYPHGTLSNKACDTTPRHGFSSLCGDDQPPDGALDPDVPDSGSVTPGGADGGDGGSTQGYSANACSSAPTPGDNESNSALPEIGILVLGYLLVRRRVSADRKVDARLRRLAHRGTELRRSGPAFRRFSGEYRRLSGEFRRLSRKHPW